jgi:hypothetical protein
MSSVATKVRKPETHEPYTDRVLITPKIAADMLEKNAENRPISSREVTRLAHIIQSGEWRLNGESIKFDWNDRLRDGQHRLSAVIEAETSIEAFVVYDLNPDTFSTMDQGRGRTVGDILAIAGTPKSKATGLAVATLYRILKDRPIHGSVDKIPPYGALEILRRHPGISDSIEFCTPLYSDGDKPVSLGMLATYHYLLGSVMGNKSLAEKLMKQLATGIDLDQSDPILHFRKQILDHRSKKGVMHGQAKAAFLAKAIGMRVGETSVQRHLRKPSVKETYWTLIPGLEEAVSRLSPSKAMSDLAY